MDSPYEKISQVKLEAKQIIESLQQLNNVESQGDVENYIAKIEYLFGNLEKRPLKCHKSKIKNRQKRKLRNKLKRNKKFSSKVNKPLVETSTKLDSSWALRDQKQKPYNSKGIPECKRFLQTFELLEQLHLSRGHNSSETYKFSLKLQHLKSIWNCLLQDKLKEQTSNEEAIYQQWNEVLFGPPEKTFFDVEPVLHDFIRNRQVWDSYINNKKGSSIPIGWIMPPSDVKEQWQSYILPTNM